MSTSPPCANSPSLFPASRRAVAGRRAGNDSGGAHHVEHARDEAEQEKYDKPPRRDTEHPVDQPAEAGADQHASNEFAREPEAPGVARCSRGPISTRTIRRRRPCTPACLTKTFAETLESRREGGLIGVRLVTIAVLARAVAHLFDTRGSRQSRRARPL